MDTLRANAFINCAKIDLIDDPYFKHYHDELDKERKEIEKLGHDPEKIINILYEIWCQRIDYILDNEQELSRRIMSPHDKEDFDL